MPDAAEPIEPDTKQHRQLGAAVGAGVETAAEMAGGLGSMGLKRSLAAYGNTTAMVLIAVGMSLAFVWLRSDARDDRNEYRLQVIRTEQLAEERRREDRLDRAADRMEYRTSLEIISRDSRDSTLQMAKIYEQVKVASDQMKAASESMVRVEKLLTTKSPTNGPER